MSSSGLITDIAALRSDFPILEGALQVRLGGLKRVEGDTVVPDCDFHNLFIFGAGHPNMVFGFILEAVVDNIGEEFIQCEIDFELLFFGNTTRFAKGCHMLAEHIQIGQPICEFKRHLGHVGTTNAGGGVCRL